PPEIFKGLAQKIQKLSDQEFYALCSACSSLYSISEDEASSLPLRGYFNRWNDACKKIVPEFAFTSLEQLLIGRITEKYLSCLPSLPPVLKEGATILFNREGVSQYT